MRVMELEVTIKEMNKAYLSFNANLMASGIPESKPQLALKLKQATEHFLAPNLISVHDFEDEDKRIEVVRNCDTDATRAGATK